MEFIIPFQYSFAAVSKKALDFVEQKAWPVDVHLRPQDTVVFIHMQKNEENALISPVKDVDTLYQNVCRLFDDGELRTRLSQKGRKDIEKMSWNNAFDKMDRLIEEGIHKKYANQKCDL